MTDHRGAEHVEAEHERDAGGEPEPADDSTAIDVLVEVPMGSRNKYEFDRGRGVFVLDRMLFSAVRYPGDYGYVPDTLARDGDALDAVVILGEPTFPGCLIRARVVGMLDMTDDKGPDEKILCVPDSDPRWRHVRVLADVPDHMLDEIAHFFSIYKDLEQKAVEVHGWEPRAAALVTIAESHDRHEG